MKKKMYEKPSLEVVVMKQQPTLLAGSDGQAGVQNYNWSTETEE
jgi:hypothetical protein